MPPIANDKNKNKNKNKKEEREAINNTEEG